MPGDCTRAGGVGEREVVLGVQPILGKGVNVIDASWPL